MKGKVSIYWSGDEKVTTKSNFVCYSPPMMALIWAGFNLLPFTTPSCRWTVGHPVCWAGENRENDYVLLCRTATPRSIINSPILIGWGGRGSPMCCQSTPAHSLTGLHKAAHAFPSFLPVPRLTAALTGRRLNEAARGRALCPLEGAGREKLTDTRRWSMDSLVRTLQRD